MDQVIQYRVMAIISEMGLHGPISLIENFDPKFSIKNCGPHRLYEFCLSVRDDVDPSEFIANFCNAMDKYNKSSPVKAAFYEANEYPGPEKNWSTVYLTVATI